MRELLLPVAEGVDTRCWLLERRIGMLEDQIRAWAEEANPPLARTELVEHLEYQVCQLYEELEAAAGVSPPHEVAEAIHELPEDGFLRYLDSFHADQIIGWAGKVRWCPLALFIEWSLPTWGHRVRVYLDHVLVDDGYDEARVVLPAWAARVAKLCTSPDYPTPEGTPITAGQLRAMLGSL